MPSKINSVKREKNSESGFTLIEVMVSMAIFLIFIGSIYGLLRIANIQRGTVNSELEVMSNLRLSLNTLGRDAVNAGLRYNRIGGNIPDNLGNLRMGIPADTNATQDLLTAVMSGNDINVNNLFPTQRTDVISFAFRDVDFNGGSAIRITGASALNGGGVTLTTEANAAFNANPSLTPFDMYLISNDGVRTAIGLATARPDNSTLQFSNNAANDILGINAPYVGNADAKSKLFNCADVPPNLPATDPERTNCMNYTTGIVSAIKIFWISYQVTPDGVLTRTTYGNNTGATAAQQIQTQPLAYNIQNFQVRYLLRDGTSSNDPSNAGTTQNTLNDVVQVEVSMSAKIDVKENGVSLQRVVELKSTFSTKNLNYD